MVNVTEKSNGIDTPLGKIAFSNFELCEYRMSSESCMVYGPSAEEPLSYEDFMAGKFNIHDDVYAVQFSYTKNQNVDMGGTVYSCRVGDVSYTGKFFVDAEMYDEARMVEELESDTASALVHDMQENNATHMVKITKGVNGAAFALFKENDAIITCENGHWTVTALHPNAKNQPEYL